MNIFLKKVVLTLVFLATVFGIASVASAAVAPAGDYDPVIINYPQVLPVNGCVVYYKHGATHPSKATNNGYYKKVSVWVPDEVKGYEIGLTKVRIGTYDVPLCPGYDIKNGFNWKNPVVDMVNTDGLEFISSRYVPSKSKVGGGYINLKFLIQK